MSFPSIADLSSSGSFYVLRWRSSVSDDWSYSFSSDAVSSVEALCSAGVALAQAGFSVQLWYTPVLRLMHDFTRS